MINAANILLTEDMLKEICPIAGFAPGEYYCTCTKCKRHFTGDKRSTLCLKCAVESIIASKELLYKTYLGISVLKTICKYHKLDEGVITSINLLKDILENYPEFKTKD